MHAYKPPVAVQLPEDPLVRQIARSQARRILALRLEHRLSRLVVVDRTQINWKRIRSIEEGSTVACLDELVKLASLFSGPADQAHSRNHLASKRSGPQSNRRSASEIAGQETKEFVKNPGDFRKLPTPTCDRESSSNVCLR